MPNDDLPANAHRLPSDVTIPPPPAFERVQIALNRMGREWEAVSARLTSQVQQLAATNRAAQEDLVKTMQGLATTIDSSGLRTRPTGFEALRAIAEADLGPSVPPTVDLNRLRDAFAFPSDELAEALRATRVDLEPLLDLAIAASPATAGAAAEVLDRVERAPSRLDAEDAPTAVEWSVVDWARENGLTVGFAVTILVLIAIAVAQHREYARLGSTAERMADDVAGIRKAVVEHVENPPAVADAAKASEADSISRAAEADPDSAADAARDSTAP